MIRIMKEINLKHFVLEQFNYNNQEHFKMIDIFDQDKEIDKYIISTEESFRDVIDYYRLYTDNTIYNKIYLVKLLSGEIVESIELDGKSSDLYINYSIIEKYRNKGYCTKLLKEITIYLLEEIKHISLLIKEENTKSSKLALKVGYTIVGNNNLGYNKYQIKSQN